MARVTYDHKYFWQGERDRHYYIATWKTQFTATIVREVYTEPREMKSVLGTATRVKDTKSIYFNKWFAQLEKPGPPIKSEPLNSLADAKAWLEVIERMNR